MSTQSSTIVQPVWNYCNVLRDKLQFLVAREVESAVEGALIRSGWLRHIVPLWEAVLKSALEGKLS